MNELKKEIEINGKKVQISVTQSKNVKESAKNTFAGTLNDRMTSMPGENGMSASTKAVLLPVFFTATMNRLDSKGKTVSRDYPAVATILVNGNGEPMGIGSVSANSLFRTHYKYENSESCKLHAYSNSTFGFPTMGNLSESPEEFIKKVTERKCIISAVGTREFVRPVFDANGTPSFEREDGGQLTMSDQVTFAEGTPIALSDADYQALIELAVAKFTKD